MKKLLITALILGVGLIGYQALQAKNTEKYPSGSWRYKITVEVETPEGIKSGSAVQEVYVKKNTAKFLNPDVNPLTYEVKGEAVLVDLGQSSVLLALPDHNDFLKAFGNRQNEVTNPSKSPSIGDSAQLNINEYAFVKFSDINDPRSIGTVYAKNFEDVFGKGTKLKSLNIIVTDEKITKGFVRKYLKWYDKEKMGLDRWNPKFPDPAKYLTKDSIIKGE